MRTQSRRRYISGNGYWYVKTGPKRWVLEHRLIMEQYLGRPLRSNEDVHHRNGDRLDNRIENFELVGDAEHTKLAWVAASPSARRHQVAAAHRAIEQRIGRKLHSPAERHIAVMGYKFGVPVKQIAQDFHVPANRIYKWLYAEGVHPQQGGVR